MPAFLPRTLLSLVPLAALGACSFDAELADESFDPQIAPQDCSAKCDGPGATQALAALPEAAFATLFSPSEPALGMDLALINEVRAARAQDPNDFEEGANPYTIRYAVYNLRNPAISNALADAEDEGVDVQILIEKDQLDPARTWNTTDELLVTRGFELVEDHRELTSSNRERADLIGIAGSGLMHLKARIYQWRDPSTGETVKRLTTGSMNPGDLAVNNEETLHYLEDPQLIAQFEDKVRAVRDGQKVTNDFDPDAPLQVMFSPDGGDQAVDEIVRLIDEEDEAILLALYSTRNVSPSFGGPGIMDRLIEAHERGVLVQLITDRKQSDGVDSDGNGKFFNDGFEDDLRAAGIPVFEVINPSSQFNAMHTKYGIFGLTNPTVVTDAGNWTRAGIGNGNRKPRNDESVLFIQSELDDGLTAHRYLANYLRILRRYAGAPNQHLYQTGDASLRGAIDELIAHPLWPAAELRVDAIAHTFFGQNVFLTGELSALGRWTAESLGLALGTNAQDFPLWRSETVQLPLGAEVEAKLIKVNGSQIIWEAGGNRRILADPTHFSTAGVRPHPTEVQHSLSFREQ